MVPGFHDVATGGNVVTQVVVKAGYAHSCVGNCYVYADTPVASGSYQIKAELAGVSGATSTVQTVAAPELKFSTTSVTVGKGLNTYSSEVYVYRAVNGTNLSGVNAITVNLACSSLAICNVPATVTIPAGSYSAYFKVTGVDLGNTTVTANAAGYTATQDLAVDVITPQLQFSGLAGTKVGSQSSFRVYLSTPGAIYSGNQTAVGTFSVSLTSSAPGVATVPATVDILPGSANSVAAKLTGISAGTTAITASGSGLSSVTSSAITINP